MATNKYFQNFSYGREQDLVEDLAIESIKMHGVECKYLPRTIVKNDSLYGEDILSTFDNAAELEMYVKNVELQILILLFLKDMTHIRLQVKDRWKVILFSFH